MADTVSATQRPPRTHGTAETTPSETAATNSGRWLHKQPRTLALAAMTLICVCLGHLTSASAQQAATVQLRFTPDRLNAPTNLTAIATLSQGEGVPPPITGLSVYLPAGLRLDTKGAGSCQASRLEMEGARACPADSRIGFGGGVGVIDLGGELTDEPFTLDLFLGPRQHGKALVLGYFSAVSPAAVELVVRAREIRAPAPYGLGFDFIIPSIGTLPGVSDASIESLFVTVGAADVAFYTKVHGRRVLRHLEGIVTPKRCASGGFPYEALISFQDGTNLTTQGAIPCPH
jgi:hypothetical protein